MKDALKQIYQYLYAAYRYKYMFIFVSLAVMTAIGAYSFTLPKKYQADTTVFIESNVIDELVRGIAITPNIEDRVRVLQFAILSRDIIMKTLVKLDSEMLTKDSAVLQAYITGLADRTRINVTRRMDRFTLSIVDKDPKFAQQFINTLVGLYVEENISAKREETYGANRFLQEQIEIFKEKLEQSEDKIIDYRKKKGVYFSIDEGAALADIRERLQQVEEIELNRDTLLGRQGQLKQQLNSLDPTVDIVSATEEGNRLAVMESRLKTLLLRYTDNYPEVVHLKSEIESLKQRLLEPESTEKEQGTTRMTSLNPLYQDLQGQLFEVEAELSSLVARKKNIEETIARREKELHEVPAAQKELGILMQERDSYRTVYNDLLARMGQSEVSKQMEIGNKASTFRIVDPAILPEVPVSPDMMKMFVLSLAGGIGCGFGLVFLLENMDGSIKDVNTLESMGIDVLAVVPNIADPAQLKKRLRKDLLLLTFSGFYLVGFVGVFAYEIFFSGFSQLLSSF
ncbi:XrtA system polysaccharide chain length determinant [uncultured Desulfuromusa sp.]|uniref:XrtA system polysaccharide chain length determinant n=1 Tax=uncultured Desulfuromusa sp. TaxID=219183 RepID=UPI002AA6EE66|nr:XrtA system polysaccharide chain length determinant [uncultured Desulfuromusa sp.]